MTKAQHTPGTWTVHRFHTTGDADFLGIVTKSTRESEVGKWPRAVTGSPYHDQRAALSMSVALL